MQYEENNPCSDCRQVFRSSGGTQAFELSGGTHKVGSSEQAEPLEVSDLLGFRGPIDSHAVPAGNRIPGGSDHLVPISLYIRGLEAFPGPGSGEFGQGRIPLQRKWREGILP